MKMLTDTKIFRGPAVAGLVTGAPLGERAFLFQRDRDGAPHVRLTTSDGQVPVLHRYVVHSPDGFEWGYGGSGPAECALNLLALFVAPAEAWRLHQDFKAKFLATMPRTGGRLEVEAVRTWLADQWAAAQTEYPRASE